jgi:four helix bundle protein
LSIARGSTAEVESQLLFAVELGYASRPEVESVRELAGELHKMMAALARSIHDK